MKRVACGIAALVWALAAGCSSEDAAPSAADASVQDASTDPCSYWTTSGASCPIATKRACFPMCDTGGCFCEGAPGNLHWICRTDRSCMPDGSPLDDVSAPPFDGGGDAGGDAGDATLDDAASDASDANDASDAGG